MSLWKKKKKVVVKVTADEIANALREKYSGYQTGWLCFGELRNITGYGRQERYIDMFAMNVWPSKGFERIAFEIKVTKADFHLEISNPEKRKPFVEMSNRFYFVTPGGLLRAGEIPEECGLMEYTGKVFRIAKEAPLRGSAEFPVRFAASIMRQFMEVEKRVKD